MHKERSYYIWRKDGSVSQLLLLVRNKNSFSPERGKIKDVRLLKKKKRGNFFYRNRERSGHVLIRHNSV